MAGKPLTVDMYEIDLPDVLLWAIWAIQQYEKEVGTERCLKLYSALVYDIVDFIRKGKHSNLSLEPNALVKTDGKERAVTWMNSTVNGRPVVPRKIGRASCRERV